MAKVTIITTETTTESLVNNINNNNINNNINNKDSINNNQPNTLILQTPSLLRRLSAAFYEAAMTFGIVFLPAYLYLAVSQTHLHDLQQGGLRLWLYQFYIFIIFAVYFGWSWSEGRRTLAQKTWGLRVLNVNGSPLSQSRAVLRYSLAWLSLLSGFLGFFYAFLNKERLFLHDKLLGTRIVIDETGAAYSTHATDLD